jgi:arylsulfatase A-like enzyme
VVFAGDNGLAVGRHGLFGKQNVYEHSVRVPLILRGPGIPAGKRSDAFCYLLDLFPTLCELAGVRAPENEGHSLVPAMREDKKIRENLFFAYRNVQRGVRDERFKLIEYAVGQARTTQLFDLAADPDETKNLAADPAFEKELARMRKELAAWRAGLGDAE